MVKIFLYLRLLSASVLVLSDLENSGWSPIVVTYMSREEIPPENWKDYKEWDGDCSEKEGKRELFTKVYLWEWDWILEGKWKNDGLFEKNVGLFEKLKNCKDIIEFNIDGGQFGVERITRTYIYSDQNDMKNYAKQLVQTLQKMNRKPTITWYDNTVYGMDWNYGPYADTKKFTWMGGETTVVKTTLVQKLTYPEFWKKLIFETCKKDGECVGMLVAFSLFRDISCQSIIKPISDEEKKSWEKCMTTYNKYSADTRDVDDLIKYLEKNRQHDHHSEL